MGLPKFYEKKYFIVIKDQIEETSGSASNPIVLGNNNPNEPHTSAYHETPPDYLTILSDSSLSGTHSPSSTDESLRIAIDNYDGNTDLDSELFNAELENYIN